MALLPVDRRPSSRDRSALREDPWWLRFLERLSAGILLALLSPVFLATALAIKLESPRGPVFYHQERVGLNRRRWPVDRRGGTDGGGPVERTSNRRAQEGAGQPFAIWKFRTMVPDAESGIGPVWAVVDDPRITRVGRVLRSTRLDELPQLINVVRGDMRLVGPRPERPHFVGRLAEGVPKYRDRLQVPPGITGLAQVERSYDSDLEDVRTKLQYDLFYIENRRPILDLKIILKTVLVVFGRRGSR